MNNKRFVASILEIVIGAVLVVCSFMDAVDEFWSGLGTAFVIIGILQLIRHIRYRTNEEYKETVDVEVNDERNKYISLKAWSWAGYMFVMIAAVGTIIFKLIGQEEYMMLASGSVCLVVLLYWISYVVLRRKY